MNVILIDENDLIDQKTAVLTGRRHQHLVSILKAQKGGTFKAGLINGPLGRAVVLEINEERAVLAFCYEKDPAPKIPLTVISALPRPPVFRRMAAFLTAMGVEKMIFIQTARVEKSYWNSPSLKEDHVRQSLILGLEQSGDTVIPEVSFSKHFKSFADDALPLIADGKTSLLAHPKEASPCPAGINGSVVLAVGPEGGFTDDEVETFCAAGFRTVHLGSRILRVETAVQAFIGRIMPV